MSYTIRFNGQELGNFLDFATAYKKAIALTNGDNLWHVMMYPYALHKIKTDNPLLY